MKEAASIVGSVKYTKKGKDAVSYEIVPSTLSVSLDANGDWTKGTTTTVDGGDKVAVVSFTAYKITGSKREEFNDCYWLGGSVNPIQTSTYARYVSKTDTAVDITLCQLTWTSDHLPKAGDVLDRITVTVNKAGKDGASGKSLVCQYSADKSNWHDGFKTGDVWMRSKIEGGSWGDAMRIVGENGINGEYTRYSFAISADEATSGVGVSPNLGVDGVWSDAPVLTTSEKPYLWMRIVKYDSNGSAGTPSYARMNGKDGKNGTSVDIKGSKASPDDLPTNGKNGDTYIIDGNLWVYTDEEVSGSKNGFINAGNIKGEPGNNATQYYYHIAWCNNIETFEGFTVSNPSGSAYAYMGICYTDDVNDPGKGSEHLYKWSKVEGKPAVTYEIALDTTSVVADGDTQMPLTTNWGNFRFLRHEGDKTEECDIYGTLLYLVLFIGYDGKVLGHSVEEGFSDIYLILTNNVDSNNVAMIKFFWYDKSIQDDGYNYTKRLVSDNLQGVPSSDMNIMILASNTFTVVKQGTNGKRGSSGAVWRQHKDFVEASYNYQAGGNDERFLDVVYIDKVWYRCIKSYESTGINDERNKVGANAFSTYWDSADMSGFTFIATDFLLAENAQINLFGAQEINLLEDVSTGEIFGSYRVPSGNEDDIYALWLGAATGKNAPFSVTKNGAIKADSGSIGPFVIRKNENFYSQEGLYYGEIMDESRADSNKYYTFGFSLCKKNLSFGISGDNVIFSQSGYCEQVTLCKSPDYTTINGKFYVALSEPALDVVKRLSDYPQAQNCIAASVESVARPDSASTALQLSASGGAANYALECLEGDINAHGNSFMGALQPIVRKVAQSTTLLDTDCIVVCTNTAKITLNLPKGKLGRFFIVIQAGARIDFLDSTLSSRGILCQHDANSNKTYQWNFVVYDGSNWHLRGLWNE